MAKLVVAGLMVLLGCCSLIHTAGAVAKTSRCGDPPNTYPEFPYNLKVVLDSLATDTTTEVFSYSRFYPNKTTAGSCRGIARCHTYYSENECRKCLGDARDSLASCVQKMTGNYSASSCDMEFWQVKSNT